MGLRVTIQIHQQNDVVIPDIVGLNAKFAKTSMKEMLSFYNDREEDYPEPFVGFFKVEGNHLKIACNSDGYFEGYDDWTQAWSFFNWEEAAVISNGITAGKLVFFKQIEGNDDEFWIITPGNVELINRSEIVF